jgi:hypothetical protein
MATVEEHTKGKIRDLPISPALRKVLLEAAGASGVDLVKVTSGGQCRKGTCTKRTGSQRHDDGQAADLQLIVGGRTLKFTSSGDLATFKSFVTAAARAGATGLGAGVDYMGETTIHVGFGSKAVWGAGGKAANAPEWIRRAAQAGWQGAGLVAEESRTEDLDSPDEEIEEDHD